ncbi:hypothetical protein GIB67_032991 [Kingdonia uniflora]|uniref:Uncharacterized protein n=1 Tax=Kingdonia uniflora TaxID=39325 RepID=A0A7J7MYI2_9MAGN|nr:hypothetical protein GIB67_032991 [Kingdonia uniflora]
MSTTTPDVVEFSAENGDGGEEEKPKVEILPSQQVNEISRDTGLHSESGNGNPKDVCQSVQGEAEMWESCKIGENNLLPEKEHNPESFEGEVDSKADEDSFDRVDVNGDNLALLHKFLKSSKGGLFGNNNKWNFAKFLVDKDRHAVDHYTPTTSLLSFEIYILWEQSFAIFWVYRDEGKCKKFLYAWIELRCHTSFLKFSYYLRLQEQL